jgi:uncharacterized protein (TIGR02996 family)
MLEDEPFLRAILANPNDRVTRLVYADWLDDRDDPRAELFRLEARLADALPNSADRLTLRKRVRELQASLPSWWLLLVGGLHATSEDDRMIRDRIDAVARAIGRPAKYTSAFGYEVEITDAATCVRTGAMAYLESQSKTVNHFCDINYTLRLRGPGGQATSWEPETYNPYFGCRVRFLEWYDNVVLFIYREKHRTYIARVGFDVLPDYREIEHDWVLSGEQLGYIGYRETVVRRLSIPQLEELPPLSLAEAAERELLPRTRR